MCGEDKRTSIDGDKILQWKMDQKENTQQHFRVDQAARDIQSCITVIGFSDIHEARNDRKHGVKNVQGDPDPRRNQKKT